MDGNFRATDRYERLRRHLPAVFLVAVIVLAASVRLRLHPIPLERDEAEYA
jgi:hypothetical protein